MAPELGLFLCECIYHAYNTRYAGRHEPLALDDYAADVDAFKESHIYPHMAHTEKTEGTVEAWVRMLPLKQIRNSYEWARKKDGGRAFMSKADKREAEKRDDKKRKRRDAERREPQPAEGDHPGGRPQVHGKQLEAQGRGAGAGRGGGGGKGFTPGGAGRREGGRGSAGAGRVAPNRVKGGAERAMDEFDPAELGPSDAVVAMCRFTSTCLSTPRDNRPPRRDHTPGVPS